MEKNVNKGPPIISHIEGATSEVEIANKSDFFNICDSQFDSVFVDRNVEVDVLTSTDDKVKCGNWLLNVEEVDKAIKYNLRLGKAADIDQIVAEHIAYAHLQLYFT